MKLSKMCVPGEGLHAHGPFGFALFDAFLTVLVGWMLSKIFGYNLFVTTIALLLLGVVVHRALGVNTTLNTLIFGIV